MSDDIVTRLRESATYCNTDGNVWAERDCLEAANEIERLQKENDDLRKISEGWWFFHVGKITPEEMHSLLLRVDGMTKRPIVGIYDK